MVKIVNNINNSEIFDLGYGNRKDRFCIYARESSRDSNKSPDINNQIDIIKEYVKTNETFKDMELYAIYKDRESGTSWRRKGFNDMLRDAKSHKFAYVLITNTDRFARDPALFAHGMKVINSSNVDVYTLSSNEKIDMTTADGKIKNNLFAVMDASHSWRTGEKVKTAYEHKKSMAKKRGLPFKWGRTNILEYVDKDKLLKDIAEIKVIHPKYGLRSIAQELPEVRVNNKMRKLNWQSLRRFIIKNKPEYVKLLNEYNKRLNRGKVIK